MALKRIKEHMIDQEFVQKVNNHTNELNNVKTDLAHKVNKGEITKSDFNTLSDKDLLDLNNFNEETRATLLGLTPGQVNAVLGYKNVKTENVAFIEESSNMIDERQLKYGYTLGSTTGQEVVNVDYAVSPFLKIKPETFYTMFNVARWAIYDENQQFIASSTSNQIKGTGGAEMGYTNAHYARVVVAIANINKNTVQMNEGETLLPYEEYFIRFKGDLGDLRDKQVTSEKIDEKAVSFDHLSFIEESTNRFDKNSVLEGYTIVASTGEPVENADYNLSEFIEVKPNTTFVLNGVSRRAWYDQNKAFIGSTVNNTEPFTTTLNTRYLRLVVHNSDIDIAQMNEGETLLPYEAYSEKHLTDEAKKIFYIEKKIDFGTKDYFPIDLINIDGEYSAPDMEDMSTANIKPLQDWKSTDIYSVYDDLMNSYPQYISKSLVGNEPTGLPIYKYEFKPALPEKQTEETKFPKIILLSGTHCEKTGVWVNYLALKEICQSWKTNSMLEALRWNVHFIVVPLVNPWGFDNDARKNSNGVDLNRNFPTDWRFVDDPTAETYGGTNPLSEVESVYIDNLMQEHKDAIYLSDFHNFFSAVGNTELLYNSAGTTFNINLGKMIVSKMTRKFKKEYPELPQDDTTMFGFSERSPQGGIGRHASSYGIQGSTFEVTNRFFNDRSNGSLTMKTGTESFVNWLCLVLKNNISLANRL